MRAGIFKGSVNEKSSNKTAKACLAVGAGFVSQDKSVYSFPVKAAIALRRLSGVVCGALALLMCSSLLSHAQMPVDTVAPSQAQPCGTGEDEASSPALERFEIQQLLKLARLGSTTVLYSHNNKFSVDAWEELARTFKARGFAHFVEWRSQEVYEWDNEGYSLEKKKVPIHAGHFADLIDANLQMAVHEPVLSNLNLSPKNGADTSVVAKGFEYELQEPNKAKEKASERTRSELGRTWANLAQRASSRGNRLILKISSNRFSEADMLEILQKGGNIELNISGATRYDAQVNRGAGTPTGYEKVKGFLQTVKNHNLGGRFMVRYNNRSLEDFLLESKAGRPKASTQAGR
jgi:hypothetical protein